MITSTITSSLILFALLSQKKCVAALGYGTRDEFSSNAKAAAAAASSSSFRCALLPAASGCSIKFIVALSSEAARQHPAEVPFRIALV